MDTMKEMTVRTSAAIQNPFETAMLIGARPTSPPIAANGITARTSAMSASSHAQASLLMDHLPSVQVASTVPVVTAEEGLVREWAWPDDLAARLFNRSDRSDRSNRSDRSI